MKLYAKIAYERMHTVNAFRQKHAEKLKTNVLVDQLFTDIGTDYTALNNLLIDEDKNLKVATDEKDKAFQELVREGTNINGLLYGYGNYKGFTPFVNIPGCKKSDLNKARDEEVLKNLQTMQAVMAEHPDQATEAGVSAERLTAFGALIAKAIELLNGPKLYRQKQRDIKAKQEEIEAHFNGLLNDSLKPIMLSTYAESDPVLYNEFVNAKHIDSLPSRKKILTGKFTNEKGEPVSKVSVSIDGKKAVVRGGKKGEYFFYNVSPGQHSLEFCKKSYKPEKRVIMLEADHSMVLDIVFHLEDIVEEVEA